MDQRSDREALRALMSGEGPPLKKRMGPLEVVYTLRPPTRSVALRSDAGLRERLACTLLLLIGYLDFVRGEDERSAYIGRHNAWRLLRKRSG